MRRLNQTNSASTTAQILSATAIAIIATVAIWILVPMIAQSAANAIMVSIHQSVSALGAKGGI